MSKKEFWDEWRGTLDGDPVMLIKRLASWKGWHIDLHGFIREDLPGCYHTHVSWAFRLVLRGGYVEELENGEKRTWFPTRCGFVAPKLSHRVDSLLGGRSYSIWIRSPKRREVELRGPGWGKHTQ